MNEAPSGPEPAGEPGGAAVELSIVLPCLNEADTLGKCIAKARAAVAELGLAAEIVVADNGSTDGSPDIARRSGARLVPVAEKGYGAALMGGIEASRGRYILMADADDSYDLSAIAPFVEKIRQGHDLVMGCRLPAGGGTVRPGAMPWTHRRFGNPMFTLLARWWFGMPAHDVYCGMRCFTRALYDQLGLRCTGMEFATEMVIKASLFGRRIAEVPVTLHPDGRVAHPPHLKTVSDGLRTLRFFLLYAPNWLFLLPGIFLFLAGTTGMVLLLPGDLPLGGGVRLGVHTMLAGGLACLLGQQLITFGVFTEFFALSERLIPHRSLLVRLSRSVGVRTGFWCGGILALGGLGLIAATLVVWRRLDFGTLPLSSTMRMMIPGCILMALGAQTVFSSFFMSILGLKRKT